MQHRCFSGVGGAGLASPPLGRVPCGIAAVLWMAPASLTVRRTVPCASVRGPGAGGGERHNPCVYSLSIRYPMLASTRRLSAELPSSPARSCGSPIRCARIISRVWAASSSCAAAGSPAARRMS